MVITWLGEGCVKIQSGENVLLIDPPSKESGLSVPRFKSDVVIKTYQELPAPFERPETPMIYGPGEYEVGPIEIFGAAAEKETNEKQLKTIYRVEWDEMKIVFLGGLSEMPEIKSLEPFMGSDIVFVPAGGAQMLDQKDAAKLARQLNARIAIPTFFKISGLKRKADDVKVFLKEIGQSPEAQEKLVIKKKEILERLKVVLLKI